MTVHLSTSNDPDELCRLARALVTTGQVTEAVEYYQAALKVSPTHTGTLCELADLQMSGPHYLKALADFHQQLKPKCYVEIGVCKGNSFSLVQASTLAIGVDPAPQLNLAKLPDNHKVITDTSDNYFSSGVLSNDLRGQSVDLAFIDGMHLFEYALRDFINLEQHSATDAVILVHDVYPMNEPTARRERIADFWSGDVWKLVICLKELRPDLSVQVLPCPPTGLGVITHLDPGSNILSDQLESIIRDYVNLPFGVLSDDMKQALSVVDCVDIPSFVQSLQSDGSA